jgi:membrane-bound ClpP family serine protease
MIWIVLSGVLCFGLLLILLEILFVPGTTIVGILGAIFTLVGIVYAFQVLGNTQAWAVTIVALSVNLGAIVYGFNSNVWKKFALKEVIGSRAFDDRLIGLEIGMEGFAVSDIKPYGKAEFNDKVFEVKSNAGFINVGTSVKITKLENNLITVKS